MWNICRWQTNNSPQPCVYEINNYVNNSCRINISHLISCTPTDHRSTALWWRRNSGKFYTENTVFLVIIPFFHNGILIMWQQLITIFQCIIHLRFLSLWNVIVRVRHSVTFCLNATCQYTEIASLHDVILLHSRNLLHNKTLWTTTGE